MEAKEQEEREGWLTSLLWNRDRPVGRSPEMAWSPSAFHFCERERARTHARGTIKAQLGRTEQESSLYVYCAQQTAPSGEAIAGGGKEQNYLNKLPMPKALYAAS